MKIEENQTRFNVLNKTTVNFGAGSQSRFEERAFFKEFGNARIDRLLSRAVPRLYEVMDRFFQKKSSLITNEQEQLLGLYAEIIDFLQKNNIAQGLIHPDVRYNDAPHYYKFQLISRSSGDTDGNLSVCSGFGQGCDVEVSLSKTIGEFLERYFLTQYRQKNLMQGSYAALQKTKSLVPIEQFARISEQQYGNLKTIPYSNDKILSWEKVVRASDGSTTFVPAQMVYWNYQCTPDEPRIIESNTNGGGGHFSKEEAIISGLYELIQRDAFLMFWLNRISPPKINPESIPDEQFQVMVRDAKRFGFILHCLDITVDNKVPSFVVVIEDPTGLSPKFVVGAGTRFNPVAALRSAMEEAWAVYDWIRQRPYFSLPDNYVAFSSSSIGRDQRLRLWSNPEMKQPFQFFISGIEEDYSQKIFPTQVMYESSADELRQLVARIENFGSGYEVYYYMVNSPVLTKLGYFVAKVIVPQLVPLYLNETMAPLESKRLKNVPNKIGYSPAEVLNPLPHPFP